MDVVNWKDRKDVTIEKLPYRGAMLDVKGVSVRWLSKFGEKDADQPEYGLRFFTIQSGGEIPIHNHFYIQTVYTESGQFECLQSNSKTHEIVKKVVCGPGDGIYVPSLEPHGMRNISENEAGTFLCCICNVYEDEAI